MCQALYPANLAYRLLGTSQDATPRQVKHAPNHSQRGDDVLERVAAYQATAEFEYRAVTEIEQQGQPVKPEHRQDVAVATVARRVKPQRKRDQQHRGKLHQAVGAQIAHTAPFAPASVEDTAQSGGDEER